MAPSPVGVALLGTLGRDDHLAALSRTGGMRLVGEWVGPGERDAHGVAYATPEDVLDDDDVGVVAVLTTAADRMHWVEQAVAGGRRVLSAPPPARTLAQVRRLVEVATICPGSLLVEAPPLHAGFGDDVRRCASRVGVPLYATLRVIVPSAWMAGRREGIVESLALWAPHLLTEAFGPVDAIAAHTRSLVRNQPDEDLAVAHMTFGSGLEALLEAHALVDGPEGTAQFEVFGTLGLARAADDLCSSRVDGLCRQYEVLRDADRRVGAIGDANPGLTGDRLETAMVLVHWLRQSARLGRRLYRDQVEEG